jgi:hypothetical protein
MTLPRTINRYLSVLAALAALVSGCGHPASQQECEEIFRRSAEIELRAQNINDPNLIEDKISEAKAVRGAELLDECVGKRITDEAMECVRGAKTADELDTCLE